MGPTPRIVVFTGSPSYSVRKGIASIMDALPRSEWLVVVHAPPKPLGKLLRSQWRNFLKHGWRYLPATALEAAQRLAARPPPPMAEGNPGAGFEMDALAKRGNLSVLRVGNIHAAAALERVRAFAPDLGLSLAAPILKRPLFSIPARGVLNLHKGKVPEFRGMPPAFWELWQNEPGVGCTVHWVDDKLDTGDIVAETFVPRERYSTLRGMQLRLDEAGVDLMRDAALAALEGKAPSTPQRPGGKTYRKPTLAQAAGLERRLRKLSGPLQPAPKRIAKALYHRAVLLWARLRRAPGDRVTVLLFHRVSDDARDNLTVGVEQFDRMMGLLRERCHVVPIEAVADGSWGGGGSRGKPAVCITFDDGYLDNRTHAAAILQRHGLPAAFFVSTGLMGTERNFPHDERRGNAAIANMGWDDLRAMRAAGFTIGSHSVNHIDCAAEPLETVVRELAESRDALRRELGVTDPIFAYPYGKRKNMTPERLERVKEAGYSACLSAYGGVNGRDADRFNILRKGIHWEYSDAAFLYECLGRS
jgi:peptidoglycan/xylan/chitin deacetylase (PgdA/CDA1 family)